VVNQNINHKTIATRLTATQPIIIFFIRKRKAMIIVNLSGKLKLKIACSNLNQNNSKVIGKWTIRPKRPLGYR